MGGRKEEVDGVGSGGGEKGDGVVDTYVQHLVVPEFQGGGAPKKSRYFVIFSISQHPRVPRSEPSFSCARSKIHRFSTKNWWGYQEKSKKVNRTTRNSSETLHTTILKWFELGGTLLATALAVFL